MTYTRWYDRDKHIKLIIEMLEQMDEKVQHAVAADLIQMILEVKPDADQLIKFIDSTYAPIRRRWYDKDDTVLTAVELLKLVEDNEKGDFLKEIFYSILHFKSEYNSE